MNLELELGSNGKHDFYIQTNFEETFFETQRVGKIFSYFRLMFLIFILKIIDHVNLISNPDQSEIVQYIRVTLKTNTLKPQIKKQHSIPDEKSTRELTPQSVRANEYLIERMDIECVHLFSVKIMSQQKGGFRRTF